MSPFMADFVVKVFCPSECVRLIQDQASMRNVDSRIHSLRFDCCVFLFYSFSAVTFATKSAQRYRRRRIEFTAGIGRFCCKSRRFQLQMGWLTALIIRPSRALALPTGANAGLG